MQEQRYTLTLPAEIYEELKVLADQRKTTIKDLVRQSLKLALLAMKLEDDPNAGIYLKERLPDSDSVRETRLLLL